MFLKESIYLINEVFFCLEYRLVVSASHRIKFFGLWRGLKQLSSLLERDNFIVLAVNYQFRNGYVFYLG